MQAQGTENRPCYCWCWAGTGQSSGQGLLWVSQHCRWGLKASSGPAPSPALLHLPEPRDGTGAGPGSPQAQQGLLEELGFHWPQSWQQSSRGAGDWGFPKSCFSIPHNWNHPARAQRLCWLHGDTGETQRTLESSFCPDSGITAGVHPSCSPALGVAVEAGEQRAPRAASWGCEGIWGVRAGVSATQLELPGL